MLGRRRAAIAERDRRRAAALGRGRRGPVGPRSRRGGGRARARGPRPRRRRPDRLRDHDARHRVPRLGLLPAGQARVPRRWARSTSGRSARVPVRARDRRPVRAGRRRVARARRRRRGALDGARPDAARRDRHAALRRRRRRDAPRRGRTRRACSRPSCTPIRPTTSASGASTRRAATTRPAWRWSTSSAACTTTCSDAPALDRRLSPRSRRRGGDAREGEAAASTRSTSASRTTSIRGSRARRGAPPASRTTASSCPARVARPRRRGRHPDGARRRAGLGVASGAGRGGVLRRLRRRHIVGGSGARSYERTNPRHPGRHVPERVVTNDDLSTLMDTTDDWIQQRTGIQRAPLHRGGRGAGRSGAPRGARGARRRAVSSRDDLDLHPPRAPVAGLRLAVERVGAAQRRLGLRGVPAMDVRNQCSGFLYMLGDRRQVHPDGRRAVACWSSARETHSTGLDLTTPGARSR